MANINPIEISAVNRGGTGIVISHSVTNNCSWLLNDLAVRYNINNFRLWQQFALIIRP